MLVHADYLQESRPLFDAVGFISAHFRMGVFMVISGLLAGSASARCDAGVWVRRRALGIAVPLLTGLALTGPTIALLGNAYGLNGHQVPSAIAVHHIWFLLALLIYLPLVPAFELFDRRFGVIEYVEGDVPSVSRLQLLVLGPAAVASAILMGGAALASHRWGPFTVEASDLVNNVPAYAPMFLMGIVLGRAPRLRSAVLSDVRMPVAVLAAMLLIELASSWTGNLAMGETGSVLTLVLGLSVCPVLVAVLVLRSANEVRKVGPLVRGLSDAAMTMYIVHFPILAVLNVAFGHLSWNVYAEYALAALTAGVLSYGFHQSAVRRSSVLRTLFNGRFSKNRPGSSVLSTSNGASFAPSNLSSVRATAPVEFE